MDESHATVPQIGGMYEGDRSRKTVLVEHGFRLPSALDNRPLNFLEFQSMQNQTIYVSATPAQRESDGRGRVPVRRWGLSKVGDGSGVVEHIVRPTGLIDPKVTIKPLKGQIDDLMEEVPQTRRQKGTHARHDADQTHGGGIDRLPARHRRQRALSAQRN